jgi:D-3-phosphoglycerate dehydrogenase
VSDAVDVLAVGDGFIGAERFAGALGAVPGIAVRTVAWGGDKAEQHEQQQVMERRGPNAVPVPAELVAAVPGAAVLAVHFAPVGSELLAAAEGLKLVAVARAGLENVDLEAASRRGIGVVGVRGRNAGAVAELQLGLMLAESRNIARADASVKASGWRKDFPGARIEIAGRTVGTIGLGHVGMQFARRLRGFGARQLGYDPYVGDDRFAEYGVTRAATLDEVFAESDFVVVQARHTPETDRFIGAAQFALMRPGAYFVNVARSRLVDTDALYAAVSSGAIAGAGLDVHDDEPLAPDDRFRHLDNVTLTTHFGGDTEETNHRSTTLVADAVAEYVSTGRVTGAANAAELGWPA